MVEGRRVVLEGGMLVGLTGMTGITRFAEQGQVGQPVLCRHRPQAPEPRRRPGIVDGNEAGHDNGQRRQQAKDNEGRTQG